MLGKESYSDVFNRLLDSGTISDHQLKGKTDGTAKVFDEMVIYVNSAYFEENGGYDFAKRYYDEAMHQHMTNAGFPNLTRGSKGSNKKPPAPHGI